jgi:hypothetical protein
MDNNIKKTRDELMEECFERGLPVMGDDSVETLLALIDSDDDDYFVDDDDEDYMVEDDDQFYDDEEF